MRLFKGLERKHVIISSTLHTYLLKERRLYVVNLLDDRTFDIMDLSRIHQHIFKQKWVKQNTIEKS